MEKIFKIAMVSLLITMAGCTSESVQALENKKIKSKYLKDSVESQERFQSMFLPAVGEYDLKFFIKKVKQFDDEEVSYIVLIPSGEEIVYNFSNENFKGVLPKEVSGVLHGGVIYLKGEGGVINSARIKISSKEEFSYQSFKSVWLFEDLLPYVKEFELSVWDNEDREYPIENYEHFVEVFESGCRVLVSPKPAGILKMGSFRKLIGKDGKDWWFRKSSMARRGESYSEID